MNGDINTPLRFSLEGKRWQYRGEGNANLVLSLTQERHIVRFRKDDVTEVSGMNGAGEAAEKERIWREAVFCRGVMAPLLGHCYVQPPTAAYVQPDQLRRIDRLLHAQRPIHRHHKGLHYGHVMVYPDYALLPAVLSPVTPEPTRSWPTFCVEVKPKQGWLPAPDRRLSKCTYCLNQYLKLKNGMIRSRSKYCPLDLFSGYQFRMKKALHSLLRDPQNNLKLFQDGVLVYGEDVSADLDCVLRSWFPDDSTSTKRLEDKLCCLVFEALCRNLSVLSKLEPVPWDLSDAIPGDTSSSISGGVFPGPLLPLPGPLTSDSLPGPLLSEIVPLLTDAPCEWSSVHLPRDCILARILWIQRLEVNGSDHVYKKYLQLLRCSDASDYSYVDTILSSSVLSAVERYLLATTAKDCSVMMAFRRVADAAGLPQQHVVQDADAVCYAMNVGVSDLDPKPLSCIEKHRKRDYETLLAVRELSHRQKVAREDSTA